MVGLDIQPTRIMEWDMLIGDICHGLIFLLFGVFLDMYDHDICKVLLYPYIHIYILYIKKVSQ